MDLVTVKVAQGRTGCFTKYFQYVEALTLRNIDDALEQETRLVQFAIEET